ncbi:MAG: PAS domain S-box protein [Microscillaceae bacterium]|nr:PAS domain S-box protein [Microscillaceae bacterium]MDW8460094.1 PAS domain S-box protein [Cytophagales bacterium]
MIKFALNSIKTGVGLFFFINVLLVIFNYGLTVISNNTAQEEGKYVRISEENENLLEEINYITNAIVNGDIELKTVLKNKVEAYGANLEVLRSGGDATIGSEIVTVEDIPRRGKENLANIIRAWADLKTQLQIIVTEQVQLDTILPARSLRLDAPQKRDSLTIETAKTDTTKTLEGSDRSVQMLNPEIEKAYNLAQTNLEDLLNKNRELTRIYSESFDNSQFNFQLVLFFTVLLNLILLSSGYYFIAGSFVNPLKKISIAAKNVAQGDVEVTIPYNRKNEIGEVADSLNLLVDSFREYTRFAENIGRGNFDINFEVKSEKDTLGYTLLAMRDNLKRVAEEDRKRNWANEGFAKFSSILRSSEKDLTELSYDIISNLVKYVGAVQGGIFLLEHENSNGHKENAYLDMKACFAYNKRKYEQKKLSIGQGLVGQSVLEKETIYMEKLPEEYIKITSGLGEASPRTIVIVPLITNNEIYGAIELASLRAFQPFELDFIQRLSENIASAIATVRINENTKRLLEETRLYAEQAQAQEEEMRQNMEELASTQEEMQRNNKRLEEYKRNLEAEVAQRTNELIAKENELAITLSQLQGIIDSTTAGIVAVDLNYKIVAANKSIKKLMRKLRNSEPESGKSWLDIFIREKDKEKEKGFWDRAFAGENFTITETFGDNPQEKLWFETNFSPIVNEEGAIIGATMLVLDVTEITNQQRKISRYANILDNSTNEVYLFSGINYKFVEANERGRKNLGYSAEEIVELAPYEIESHATQRSFLERITPLQNGQVTNLTYETTFIRKNGTSYDVEVNLQFFPNEDIPLFAAIVQDITERKQKELQLEEALKRFDLASKATNEGLWEFYIVDENNIAHPQNKFWWSAQSKSLLGYEEHELPNDIKAWLSQIHPEDIVNVVTALQTHLLDRTGKVSFNVEYRLQLKNKTYQWFSSAGQAMRDEQGKPVRMAGSIRNINRRKRTEEELLEQTAKVNAILNAAVNSILSIDTEGKITLCNQATERTFGYSTNELIGQPLANLFANPQEADLTRLEGNVQEILLQKKNQETFLGEVSVSKSLINSKIIYVAILRDITKIKEKEAILEESEERFRNLAEATNEGIIFHEKGIIYDVNEAICKLSGYTREELIGKNSFNLLTEKSQKIAREYMEKNIKDPYEAQILTKNGLIIDAELQVRSIKRTGKAVRILAIRDITRRKQIEHERNQLIAVLETLNEQIFTLDAQNTIQHINKAAYTALSYNNAQELKDKNITELFTELYKNLFLQNILPQAIQNGAWQGELELVSKNNKVIRSNANILVHKNTANQEIDFISIFLKN